MGACSSGPADVEKNPPSQRHKFDTVVAGASPAAHKLKAAGSSYSTRAAASESKQLEGSTGSGSGAGGACAAGAGGPLLPPFVESSDPAVVTVQSVPACGWTPDSKAAVDAMKAEAASGTGRVVDPSTAAHAFAVDLPSFSPEKMALCATIRHAIIGQHAEVQTPFGKRKITYADYTASGRALSFVEDFVAKVVLPLYANTHTEVSLTGLQTGTLREQARDSIKRATNCTDDDAVLFCGSGATAAINLFADILGLKVASNTRDKYGIGVKALPESKRPVVFVGPQEHHSNELIWRESIADCVVIGEDHNGLPNLEELEAKLKQYKNRPLIIGSFSAGSNVTGITADTAATTRLVKSHGGLMCWDYAGAGPYVRIDMNPSGDPLLAKDAVFLSPHKFVGGPGSSGVLVVKKALCDNRVPVKPGGGTVKMVNSTGHTYLSNIEAREEGGTPGIIQDIRAGLVFKLKDQIVGSDFIEAREAYFVGRAIKSWASNPNIILIGGNRPAYWSKDRLSIVSFLVKFSELPPEIGAPAIASWESEKHHKGVDFSTPNIVHQNFVCQVLNDLYGIQARSGCACAGPYGIRLLGLKDHPRILARLESHVVGGREGLKPGWTRVNFNYFISEAEFQFIVDAVHQVALHGWKLLPMYSFEMSTGLYKFKGFNGEHFIRTLDSFEPTPSATFEFGEPKLAAHTDEEARQLLLSYLRQAPCFYESNPATAATPCCKPPAPAAPAASAGGNVSPDTVRSDSDAEADAWFVHLPTGGESRSREPSVSTL